MKKLINIFVYFLCFSTHVVAAEYSFDIESGEEIEPGMKHIESVEGNLNKDNLKLKTKLNLDDTLGISSGKVELNIVEDVSAFELGLGSTFCDDYTSNYLKFSYGRLWGGREGVNKTVYDQFSLFSGYIDNHGTRRLNLSMGRKNGIKEDIFSYRCLRKDLELFPDEKESLIEHGFGYERKIWLDKGFIKNIGIGGKYFNCSSSDNIYQDEEYIKRIGGYSRLDGILSATFGAKKEHCSFLTKLEGGYRHSNYSLGYEDGFVYGFNSELACEFGIFNVDFKEDDVQRNIGTSYFLPINGAGLKIYANNNKVKECEDSESEKKFGVEISMLTSKIKNFFDKDFWKIGSIQYAKTFAGYTSIYQAKHMNGFELNSLADNPVNVFKNENNNTKKVDKIGPINLKSAKNISSQVTIQQHGNKITVDSITSIVGIDRVKPSSQSSAFSIVAGNIEIDLSKITKKGSVWCIANEDCSNHELEGSFTLVKVFFSGENNSIIIDDIKARCGLNKETVSKIMMSNSGWNEPYLDAVKNLKLDPGSDTGISQTDGITANGSVNIIFDRVPGASQYEISAKNQFSREKFSIWANSSNFISSSTVSKVVSFNKGGHWQINVTPYNEFGHGDPGKSIVVGYSKNLSFLNKPPKINIENLKCERVYGQLNCFKYSYDLYVNLPIKNEILLPEFLNLHPGNIDLETIGVNKFNSSEGWKFSNKRLFYKDECIVLKINIQFTSRFDTDLEDLFSWDTFRGIKTSVGFHDQITNTAGKQLSLSFPQSFRIINPAFLYWIRP